MRFPSWREGVEIFGDFDNACCKEWAIVKGRILRVTIRDWEWKRKERTRSHFKESGIALAMNNFRFVSIHRDRKEQCNSDLRIWIMEKRV